MDRRILSSSSSLLAAIGLSHPSFVLGHGGCGGGGGGGPHSGAMWRCSAGATSVLWALAGAGFMAGIRRRRQHGRHWVAEYARRGSYGSRCARVSFSRRVHGACMAAARGDGCELEAVSGGAAGAAGALRAGGMGAGRGAGGSFLGRHSAGGASANFASRSGGGLHSSNSFAAATCGGLDLGGVWGRAVAAQWPVGKRHPSAAAWSIQLWCFAGCRRGFAGGSEVAVSDLEAVALVSEVAGLDFSAADLVSDSDFPSSVSGLDFHSLDTALVGDGL